MQAPDHTAADFEALFAQSDDPWQFRHRWYEERKRALTLACLPARHYGSVYEPGCANGELSALLATRCDRLLASDGSATAVQLARVRLAQWPNATVVQAWMPDDWPEGSFDLVVISELAYYLPAQAITTLARRTRACLRPGGTVVACHWRHPIAGCALTGGQVHALLGDMLALPRLSAVAEPDMCLDVWCEDGRSVGMREGLVGNCA